MPAPTTRRIAVPALCAAFLLGPAAPALAAPPDAGGTRAVSVPAVPERAALRERADALAGLGAVPAPVVRLLDTALGADDDPLSAAEAKKLADEVRQAVEQARKEALAEVAAEAAAAGKEAEAARAEAEAARAEALAGAGLTATATAAPAEEATADTTAEAFDTLAKAVDDLLDTLLAGAGAPVDPAADGVVQSLVGVLTGTPPGLPSTETGTGA